MILIGIVAVAVVLMFFGASGQKAVVHRTRMPFEPEPEPDQLELLQRYGTADDAARLADQGVDLTALGYRPPGAS